MTGADCEEMRRLADLILAETGKPASRSAGDRLYERFLCGQTTPAESRVVVRELLRAAPNRRELSAA